MAAVSYVDMPGRPSGERFRFAPDIVGMAMGTGTDVAREAAGVALMGGRLEGASQTIWLARMTMRKILQNLFWAFFYNALGIPLAAFGVLSPILAGAVMALSWVSVVSNSLLLRRLPLYRGRR